MKEYPSIDKKPRYGVPVYMFEKLDGSNIRAEWSKKKGFHKFGSRHVLLSDATEFLKESIPLINSMTELEKTLVDQRYESALLFFEFWGEHSFAGKHIEEPHKVSLIDVAPYKQGILNPDEFLKIFEKHEIAKCIYRGNFNKDIEEQIKNGIWNGMSFEGVVCKMKRLKKFNPPEMFKVKTNAWLTKLKAYCGEDLKLFEKLS